LEYLGLGVTDLDEGLMITDRFGLVLQQKAVGRSHGAKMENESIGSEPTGGTSNTEVNLNEFQLEREFWDDTTLLMDRREMPSCTM
jgi:hypothetical protein